MIQMFDIILIIIFLSFAGFVSACFSYFLQYTFREGAIFGKWLPFVARMILRLQSKKGYQAIKQADDNTLCLAASNNGFYKALGGCGVCSNIWHAVLIFVFIIWYFVPFYWIFGFLFINSFLFRKISEE